MVLVLLFVLMLVECMKWNLNSDVCQPSVSLIVCSYLQPTLVTGEIR